MRNMFKIGIFAFLISVSFIACKTKNNDAELTAQATTAITKFQGTSVEVIDGQAHLSGDFTSEAEKQAAIDAVKKIEGIKDVHDMASVNGIKK